MTTVVRRTVRALLIAIAAAAGLWLVAERLRQVARRRLIAVVPMKPAQLPADLRAALDSVFVGVRVDAVRELERWLHRRHPGRRLAAEQALRKLEQDDILQVATAASSALRATSDAMAGPTKPTATAPPAWVWRPMAAARSGLVWAAYRRVRLIRRRSTRGSSAGAPSPSAPFERFAHVTVYADRNRSPGARLGAAESLRVGLPYHIEVAVRQNLIGVPGRLRRPIVEPGASDTAHLVVTLEPEDGESALIDEPVQGLELPPEGDSTRSAWFRLQPRRRAPGADPLRLRLRLYYQLNLLEVGVLKLTVLEPTEKGSGHAGYGQERVERTFAGLEHTQPRQLAIDLVRGANGLRLTFLLRGPTGEEVSLAAPVRLDPADLKHSLVQLREALTDVALSARFSRELKGDPDEFDRQLRRLAQEGRQLWARLFPGSSVNEVGRLMAANPIADGGLVQVTVQREAAAMAIPWSLLYDRELPPEGVSINPFGFWGYRYQVEQFVPGAVRDPDLPLAADTVRLDFMLYRRFRNAGRQVSLMDELAARGEGRLLVSTPPLEHAEECRRRLVGQPAEIIYFYAHGYSRPQRTDTLTARAIESLRRRYEMLPEEDVQRNALRLLYESTRDGLDPSSSWLELTYDRLHLENLYELDRRLFPGSIVVLNTCESAPFSPVLAESFVHFFLSRGAGAVIATECPMTIEFAHPLAERVLTSLLCGRPVGEALLEARHHFLGLRNPLGLAYTLYGLATARINGPVIRPAEGPLGG